ncbi:MAG: serine/threonine protein kinase, partial [Nocardia sp.]|nr:serine/threonine protein kinase [Nocardia sp.]
RVFDQRQITDQHLKLMYMQYVPGGTLLGVLRMMRRTDPAQRNGRLLLEAIDAATTTGGVIEPQPTPARTELERLSWPETVAHLGSRLASALDYADRHGVLHRDIKPANVLLTADGQPKLADFNISFDRHLPGASPVAYFGGSLPYMAPEQLEACHPNLDTSAADLDTRTDLYALAVVLWELLTGTIPFDDRHDDGHSEQSLQSMIERRRTPIAARHEDTLPPDTPALLRHALLTCLSPDPADRYASGAELAQQLELSQDRAARDLVDPPRHSLRARLRNRPMPVVTLSSLLGQLLAGLYLNTHNLRLIRDELGDEAADQIHRLGLLLVVIGYPVAIVVGWFLAFVALMAYMQTTDTLPAGLTASIAASHLVAAAVAVVYTYFPVMYFVLRWYYPGLVAAGGTTPADAALLRRMVHRSRVYLGVAACVPLVGVPAGLVFLNPDQQQLVIGPILGLCVGGLFAFIITLRTFYALQTDLTALERMLDPHPHN